MAVYEVNPAMTTQQASAGALDAEGIVPTPPLEQAAPSPVSRAPSGSIARFVRNTWAMTRKELGAYFSTPLAYVLFAMWLVPLSVVFVMVLQQYVIEYNQAQQFLQFQPNALDTMNFTDRIFSPIIGLSGTLMLFIVPFLTMRLLAEEKRQNTYALLMTSPLRTSEIVLGKFLASQFVVVFGIGLTVTYPLLLNSIAAKGGVEWQTAAVSYLGLFLFASAMMALGLFISSLTDSQLVAAVVTFGVSLVLWFLSFAGSVLDEGATKEIVQFLAITNHLSSFLAGKIALADLTYFFSIIVLGLFLTRTSIERTRW